MTITTRQKNPGFLRDLLKRYKYGAHLAIGFPADKVGGLRYPADEDGSNNGEAPRVVDVAFQNQYGTKRIPRRDFMGPGGLLAIKKTKAKKMQQIKKINAGKQTKKGALEEMGPFAEGALKLAIRDLKEPANAPATIEAKGSSNPLVNTKLMGNSVTYEVRK